MNKIQAVVVKRIATSLFEYRVRRARRYSWYSNTAHDIINLVHHYDEPSYADTIDGEYIRRVTHSDDESTKQVTIVRRFYMSFDIQDSYVLFRTETMLRAILADDLPIIEWSKKISNLTVTIDPEKKYLNGPTHEITVRYSVLPGNRSQ